MIVIQGSAADKPRCTEHDLPAACTVQTKEGEIVLCKTCVKELSDKLNEFYPNANS